MQWFIQVLFSMCIMLIKQRISVFIRNNDELVPKKKVSLLFSKSFSLTAELKKISNHILLSHSTLTTKTLKTWISELERSLSTYRKFTLTTGLSPTSEKARKDLLGEALEKLDFITISQLFKHYPSWSVNTLS